MDKWDLDRMQELLDLVSTGDSQARRELGNLAYPHMARLASAMLRRDFPVLAGHSTASVVHNAWPRLDRFLRDCSPASPIVFLGQLAPIFRHTLLDMARAQRGNRLINGQEVIDQASTTLDPAALVRLAEFHQRVGDLPAELREIFELHYYAELPQAVIAQTLGLHPREVSRRWIAARRLLQKWLDESPH